jgi:hypothetical protein
MGKSPGAALSTQHLELATRVEIALNHAPRHYVHSISAASELDTEIFRQRA